MPIISKETWDKIPGVAQHEIKQCYNHLKDDVELNNNEITQLEWLFGKENLQPQLTYEDVARELGTGDFKEFNLKLEAIGKLMVVAKFLNKDWKPNWSNDEDKWSLCVDPDTNKVRTIKVYRSEVNRYVVYFRTEELAKQAVTILGEDIIRLALTTEY